MLKLNNLGKRICIIGPSSSGKSTLAKNLGNKLRLKVCYLDQLAHLPNTNWVIRDKELLKRDHNEFIQNNKFWIIEGNYSFLMKKRFTHATTVIWLDFRTIDTFFRYINRSLKDNASRAGNLQGATQQLSIRQIKYMKLQRIG